MQPFRRPYPSFAVCSLIAFTARTASAVIVIGPGNTGNGNNDVTVGAAPNGVGAFEGNYGSNLGTTISPQYFMTASHVEDSASSFTFGGTTYTNSQLQLALEFDDLAVIGLKSSVTPQFSTWAPLYTASTETGQPLVVLGRGNDRGAAVTGGYAWGPDNLNESWGLNTVSRVVNASYIGLGTTPGFQGKYLQFDFKPDPGNTNPNEAILSHNDSGGGVFVLDPADGKYKLAGVNTTVDQVLDVNHNVVNAALYNDTGYYYQTGPNTYAQIQPYNPSNPNTFPNYFSSYATQVSSRANLVNEVIGQISPANMPLYPVTNNGQLALYTNATTGAINGSGTLYVGTGSFPVKLTLATGTGASSTSSLTLSVGSTLDISNNHLFINYGSATDPEATVLAALTSGSNHGIWNGTGITSSAAAANGNYGVGYSDGADQLAPGLSSNQIEVMYTLYGDITLQGRVNAGDFGILAANFGKSVTGGWEQGDLNYDGVVNASDFSLLASNFGKSDTGVAIALPASDWAALDSFAASNGLASSLPEPAGGVLLAVGITALRRRRSPLI